MMHAFKCVPNDDDDGENDELLWVKAGEPGEKPTIIRQIRSESSTSGSSRDNSGGSTCNTRRNVLTVENGTVYRNTANSSESLHTLEKLGRTSSNDSRVIVVNISEHIYPAHVDKQRINRWKELHSPGVEKKFSTKDRTSPTIKSRNNNNSNAERNCTHNETDTKRPLSQPTIPLSRDSPLAQRCGSTSSPANRVKALRSRDEGYTSLSEDCKDSDNESVRSRSLPSSWRPSYLNQQRAEQNMQRYAERITLNNASTNFSSDEQTHSLCSTNDGKNRNKRNVRHHIENIVEICTCFVCVRSAVYHAEDEDDTDSLVDHPCSCDEPSRKCCGRWAVIGLMVLFLPFLIFYPPLKCCLSIHSSRKKRKRRKKEKILVKKLEIARQETLS